MNGIIRFLPLGLALGLCWSGPVFADYTLVLKNGRRITVQSYREEGGMVKFPGLGGEIGITKDQIQSILKDRESEGRGMVLPGAAQKGKTGASPVPVEEAKVEKKGGSPAEAKEKVLSPEEKRAEERAKEEEEHQSKVKEITEKIKAARDRYSLATRGKTGPEPSLPNSEEAIRARTDDLMSRLRDAQHNPRGPEGPPSVDVPLPGYSKNQKELSNLRNRISQLENERKRLIEKMKQKNFDTGSLFLE